MYQTKDVGYSIGATMDTVEKVDVNDKGFCLGNFMRIRVKDRYLNSTVQGSQGLFGRIMG